eukprot:9850258-Alexandrium_andersonii.AAC.1
MGSQPGGRCPHGLHPERPALPKICPRGGPSVRGTQEAWVVTARAVEAEIVGVVFQVSLNAPEYTEVASSQGPRRPTSDRHT